MINTLIAGTYTPFAFLVVDRGWRIPILVVVWGSAALALAAERLWRDPPTRLLASLRLVLGWVAVIILPQIVSRVGVAGTVLLISGGCVYTIGAVVYARQRPDPIPHVFGYHEVFHALVVIAVACQYAAIAFFVLPLA
jgi:hemolysin III